MKANVTLKLDRDLLREARVAAAENLSMRVLALPVLLAAFAAAGAAGPLAPSTPQPASAAPVAATALSRAEMEEFLARARVVRTRSAGKGVTGSVRATLTDGRMTHDAHIQTIDESKSRFDGARGTEFNFRDSWRFNVAAYRLDQLLELGMILPSVARVHRGKEGSFTWWADDFQMDEDGRLKRKIQPPDPRAWNEQMWKVRVFDQLIYNTDRNLGNLLITSDWRVWMIDHTRAFRWQKSVREPKDLTRCDRNLLEKMRALDKPTLTRVLDDYVGPIEIDALLARRDLIVDFFDKAGQAVLYESRRP